MVHKLFLISIRQPVNMGLIFSIAAAKYVCFIKLLSTSELILKDSPSLSNVLSGYSSAELPSILISEFKHFISILLFSIVSINTYVFDGSFLTKSPINLDCTTIDPSSSISQGEYVLIPKSKSVAVKISILFFASISIPDKIGRGVLEETAFCTILIALLSSFWLIVTFILRLLLVIIYLLLKKIICYSLVEIYKIIISNISRCC